MHRSPIALSSSVAHGCCPMLTRYSGMSDLTCNFLDVGGSGFFHESRVSEILGWNFSVPKVLKGLCLNSKAIFWPTAVIALLTVSARTVRL